MIKYGLISNTDAITLERTIDLICQTNFGVINVAEIGIFDGQTAMGIYEYVSSKTYATMPVDINYPFPAINPYECNYTAIDNNKDKEVLKPFPECKLIIGNSNEVYSQLEDNSQHLIFVDGCHCFAHVVSDFFCYADKVKVGGYMAFHDTGEHILPFKDFQHGDHANPDAYISVRKALEKIGMFEDAGYDIHMSIVSQRYMGNYGFRLIFDEADIENPAGGIIVFKKKK